MIEEINDGCCIRVFSTMNEWLDCIFIVSRKDKENAKAMLRWIYEDYWQDEIDEPYGDYFCRRLSEAGIEYEVFFAPDSED